MTAMTAAASTIAIDENISQCHNQVKTRSSAAVAVLSNFLHYHQNCLWWSQASSVLLLMPLVVPKNWEFNHIHYTSKATDHISRHICLIDIQLLQAAVTSLLKCLPLSVDWDWCCRLATKSLIAGARLAMIINYQYHQHRRCCHAVGAGTPHNNPALANSSYEHD